jgi:hypothetical protein
MRRFFLLSATALTGALALACDEQTSPTAPVDPRAPSFSVERTIEHFGFGFGDEHYLVILGATAENWAAFCATGAQNWDAWPVLTVTRPDGSQKVGWHARGLHALVWNQPADACAESPDYTGTASNTNHDNDLDLSAHGTNATGIITRGTVSDASGQDYHLISVFNGTISRIYTSADEPFVLDQHVQFVRLTPTGR